MFGSNSFRKPRFSPFGAQPAFGQQNTATNNSSAARPFGRTSPFGAQTESTLFGGNSTGIFGATPSPSPLATSTPTFGSSSTPAFGPTFGFSSTPAFDATSTPAYGATSTPAFGASSAPAFGSSFSLFGATSVFGQKPAFGGFGSPNPAQSSLFGSNFGQTQPASGSQPFGATSQSAFGSTSTPAFGSNSTPAFGATSTPTFGTRSIPAFGASSTPAFGASSTQALGASSTPSFGFGSTPTFSQSASAFGTVSTPAFGSSPSFGSTPSPFGAQNSAFGVQSTTPTFGCPDFGQTPFGGQRGGSRVAPYTTTNETDSSSSISGQTTASGKLLSISAMPQYKEKSHEELRWEDYQLGNKGGPIPASQLPTGGLFSQPTQASPFGQRTPSAFGQITTSAFGQTTSAFGQAAAANSFSSTFPDIFRNRATGFGSMPFGSRVAPYTTTNETDSSSSVSGQTTTPVELLSISAMPQYKEKSHEELRWEDYQSGDKSGTNTASQLPAGGLFSQPTQSSPFGQTTSSAFWQTTPSAFGRTTSAFGQASTVNPFCSTSPGIFGNRATGFGSTPFGSSSGGLNPASQLPAGGLFSQPTQSSPFGQTTPSAFWQTAPSAFGQTTSAFSQAAAADPFSSTFPDIFQNRATGFGSMPFGSRVAPYTTTNETDSSSSVSGQTTTAGELLSISAMPQYKEKSHEELRWEDYQLGDKGGTNPASQLPAGGLFSQPTQSSPFGQTTPSVFWQTTPSAFGQTISAFEQASTVNPFCSTSPGIFGNRVTGIGNTPFVSSSGGTNSASQLPASGLFSQPTQSSPFGQTTPSAFGQTTSAFGQTSTANPFSSTSSGIFGNRATGFGSTPFGSSPGAAFKSPFAATSVSSSLFGSSTPPAFGGASSASPCGTSSSPAFNSTPFGQAPQPGSLFGSTPSLGSSPVFGSSTPLRNTQSTGLFQSSTPAFGQTTPFFGQSTPAFSQSTPAFGRTTNVFGQITPAFGSNLFSNGTTSMMSQSNPAGLTQSMPTLFGGFQNPTTTQTQGGSFSLSNFGQPQATGGEMEASNYQISKMALGKQTREVEKENMKSAMTSIFQRMDKDKEIKEQLKEKVEQLTPMSALQFVNIDDKDMPPAGEIGCIVKATKSWMEDLVALGSKLINEAFILYHKIHDELNSLADMKKKFDEELQELKWSLPQIEEMTKIDFDILVAEEIFDGSSPSLHIEWLEAAKWRIEILEEGKTRFKEVDGISHDALIDIQDFIEKIPCDFYDDQRSINSVGVLKDQLAKVIKEELSGFDVAYIDRLVKLKILCRDFEKKLINSRRVPSKVLSIRISRDMRFRYSKGLNQEAVKEAIDKFRQHQKRVCSSEKGTINIEDSQGDGSH